MQNEGNPFRGDLPMDFQLFMSNRAWSTVYSGFEIQIDDNATADPRKGFFGAPEPPGLMKNRTGAIYKIAAGDRDPNSSQREAQTQTYEPGHKLVPRQWTEPSGLVRVRISVQGDDYTARLGAVGGPKTQTSTFTNTDAVRGVPASASSTSGYIGLQAHGGSRVAFRNIQIKKL